MGKVIIRQANFEDIPAILKVEEEAWPEGLRVSGEILNSQITTFPQGNLIAANKGEITGLVSSEIIDGNLLIDGHINWYDITDQGSIKATHNPKGDTLYGVNLSVSHFAPRGTSEALMVGMGKLVIAYGLKQGVFGSRMPRYHKYAAQMSPDEYLYAKSRSGRFLDPEIAFYLKLGLGISHPIPGYINDPESCNYGVLLTWKNPFYRLPFRKILSWLFRV